MPVDELAPGIDTTGELSAPDDYAETAPDNNEVPTYGENNVDLPEQLQDMLKELVREFQMQEQFDRRREVLRDRRNRFYERGYQHLAETGSAGVFTAMMPGNIYQNSYGNEVQCPSSIRDYNIFGRYVLTVSSILTQNPPGVDFQPDNPNNSEDVEAAEVAEGFRQYFDRCNDAKEIQTAIARMLLLSGRTVTWTRTEPNPQAFGYEQDGTPKRVQTTSVYGTLESKVPILARGLKQCPYVILSDDPDVKMAKEENPQFKDKIKPGGEGIGENEYERIARLGVMQGTRSAAQIGDALSHVTTRQYCFLRPAAFNSDKLDAQFEDPEGGEPISVQEKLNELFPAGCLATFIGQQYVGSRNVSLDDEIAVDFPFAGDGMARPAPMDWMVVIQDDFNDDMNAYREVADYGWPSRWIEGDEQDLDAVYDQKASPYATRMKKARNGQTLAEDFHQEADPNIPPTLWDRTVFLMTQLAQFILAAPPSLQGDASPDLKTASTYAQSKASALGQQGIPWMAIQRLFARIYYQAAKAALRDNAGEGEIVVPAQSGAPQTYQLAKLNGNFGAFPDQDSSFPESTSAQRANLMQLLQLAVQTPVGMQMFQAPDNFEEIKTKLGYANLVIPEAVSRNKQLREIQILLAQDPIKPTAEELQQAMQQHALQTAVSRGTQALGEPGPPPPPPFDPKSLWKPSIMPELLDNHEWEALKCMDYLSSEDAARYQAEGGDVDGLENLRLHCMAHIRMKPLKDALLASFAPPPPPVPAKGGPKSAAHGPQMHPTAAPQGAPHTPTV